MQVFANYDEAVEDDPDDGSKLYIVEKLNMSPVWVWAKTNQAALAAAAKDVGYTAHINRPGVTLEGE